MSNILEVVKKRTILLEKIDKNIESKQKRIAKLKEKNLFIQDAAPKYKECYTKQ